MWLCVPLNSFKRLNTHSFMNYQQLRSISKVCLVAFVKTLRNPPQEKNKSLKIQQKLQIDSLSSADYL